MNDSIESKQTPGEIIKATREAKNINLGEVVEKLLLSKQTVIDIENDDYDKIPAQVYAEGYLKAYAQLLQIPTDRLLKSFRELNPYSKVVESKSDPEEKEKDVSKTKSFFNAKPKLLILLSVAIVFVISLLAFFALKFNWFNAKINDEVADISSLSDVVTEEVIEEEEEIDIPVTTFSISDDEEKN